MPKWKPGSKVVYVGRQFVLVEPVGTVGWLAVEANRARGVKKALEKQQALETFLLAMNEFLEEGPKGGTSIGPD